MLLQSGLTDASLIKARRVWEAIGKKVLGFTFEEYVNGKGSFEPLPPIPVWPETWRAYFDRDVLVDGRIVDEIGLEELLRFTGIDFQKRNFVSYERERGERGIRWMRCQAGHKSHRCRPIHCRNAFEPFEIGLEIEEGSFVYMDDPQVLINHYMDLVATVDRHNPAMTRKDKWNTPYLGLQGSGRPKLYCSWQGYPNRMSGAASRGTKKLRP